MASQQPRARQIPEAKWSEWRKDVERLIFEEEASQEDILEFLRIRHPGKVT